MTTTSSTQPNVWLVEGDDHEVRLIEAANADEAVERAADEFSDQYSEPYDSELCDVVGAFIGDLFDTDSLEFVPTEGAEDESRALEALDQV